MNGSRISIIGSALADPTRAEIVAALLSGTAHTSGELARFCRVAPSTMSAHLAKLLDAGLVAVEAAGRYRYYRIASLDVAELLEQFDAIELPEISRPERPKPAHDLAYARSCYDHLAGTVGVALHDSLIEYGWVVVDHGGPELSDSGAELFERIGLDIDALAAKRRPMLRLDLDWTERRHHLAGSVPAELLDRAIANKWIVRRADKRQLKITESGREAFGEFFRLVL